MTAGLAEAASLRRERRDDDAQLLNLLTRLENVLEKEIALESEKRNLDRYKVSSSEAAGFEAKVAALKNKFGSSEEESSEEQTKPKIKPTNFKLTKEDHDKFAMFDALLKKHKK